MNVIKQFTGYSSSKILLIEEQGELFVRKFGNISRNLERYQSLENLIKVPKIFRIEKDYFDMEYVLGIDMRHYLTNHSISKLSNFIEDTLQILSKGAVEFNYSQVYEKRLESFDFSKYNLNFHGNELLERLPKILPKSYYFGDLSLDNVIYSLKDNNFVLLDPLTSVYDSYVFDIAKLRQDTVSKWFLRNHPTSLDSQLQILSDRFRCDDSLVILMLMRILPYTKSEYDRNFLTNEINRLWN
jgi:hypothetical protein